MGFKIKYEKSYTCPKCKEFLKGYRRICPFCGAALIQQQNIGEEYNYFISDRRTLDEGMTQAGAAQRPSSAPTQKTEAFTADPSDTEVFSSQRRTAANGGYTQQSTIEQKKEYTGLFAPIKGDKSYFSSNERKVYGNTPTQQYKAVAPDSKVFYHSNDSSRSELEKITNTTPDHDAAENSYEKSGLSEEQADTTKHTSVYVAHDILEFRKHKHGAYLYTRVENLHSAMVLLAAALVILDILYDPVYTTAPIALTFAVDIMILVHEVQRTCFRGAASAISAVTLTASAGLLFFFKHFDRFATAPEIFFIFVVIAALNILSLKQLRALVAYCEHWDTYSNADNDTVGVPREEVEMFSGEGRSMTEESQPLPDNPNK